MEDFTPIASAFGGVLIGIAASVMLIFNGRIAGVSGILEGVVLPGEGTLGWRTMFVAGLFVGGAAMYLVEPTWFAVTIDRSIAAWVFAGVLVGFGTRLGNGCTSGHGVCGVSRLSRRSIIATGTFMAAGFVTVYVVQHLLGGSV